MYVCRSNYLSKPSDKGEVNPMQPAGSETGAVDHLINVLVCMNW